MILLEARGKANALYTIGTHRLKIPPCHLGWPVVRQKNVVEVK